jgi:hypothetical protein
VSAAPGDGAIDAGDVVVVDPADSSQEMSEGDSNSVFALRLPEGSECPGDSANDDWRVQSFIVPAGTDLPSLTYGATRPRGEFMYGLYTTDGWPYVQVMTAQNPAPGQPGMIIQPPPLSFGVFTPDLLPVGRYTIGISCSYFERGERYWDAELILTEDPDVLPGERSWQVAAAPSESAGTTTGSGVEDGGWFLAAGVAAVAVIALIALGAALRRRQPQQTLAKEHPR